MQQHIDPPCSKLDPYIIFSIIFPGVITDNLVYGAREGWLYLFQVFTCRIFYNYSEDVQKKGFTIIVDARSEKWTNFKSILQVIKVG
jgi:hypothetical protein